MLEALKATAALLESLEEVAAILRFLPSSDPAGASESAPEEEEEESDDEDDKASSLLAVSTCMAVLLGAAGVAGTVAPEEEAVVGMERCKLVGST